MNNRRGFFANQYEYREWNENKFLKDLPRANALVFIKIINQKTLTINNTCVFLLN